MRRLALELEAPGKKSEKAGVRKPEVLERKGVRTRYVQVLVERPTASTFPLLQVVTHQVPGFRMITAVQAPLGFHPT